MLDAVDPGDLQLRTFDASPRRHVGKPHATESIRDIVTGGALFAGDVQREGMLHGGVA